MISPTTQNIIKQLKKANLSTEDRIALTTALLDKLVVLPIGDMIVFTENGISINGKELDLEQSMSFREGCVSLKENFARKVLNEQIRFKAIEMGVHKSQTIDELMFSKAAIWVINEEEILLQKLLTYQ